MSFTQEEIEFMDKEVDEDMEEQDVVFEDVEDIEDIEDMEDYTQECGTKIHQRNSDSEDSMNGKVLLLQIIYNFRHNSLSIEQNFMYSFI